MDKEVSFFILWGNLYDSTSQKKTFKSEICALEWCMRNYKNIVRIGDFWTNCQKLSHFEIIAAIRGDFSNVPSYTCYV